MTLFALLLSALIAQAAPNEQASSTAPKRESEQTALPSPGIESGTARGLTGGRTDQGPDGRTGIEDKSGAHSRSHALKDDQARGRNARGSLERPADSAADMNRDPRPIGSGVEPGTLPSGGQNYRENNAPDSHGKAGGIASGSGNPGGSSSRGSGGKAELTQPPDHSGTPVATPSGPNH